jgi:hypothetical protein
MARVVDEEQFDGVDACLCAIDSYCVASNKSSSEVKAASSDTRKPP